MSGTTLVSGAGRTIEFVPDLPWVHSALVQIFLDTTARDVSGNALNS